MEDDLYADLVLSEDEDPLSEATCQNAQQAEMDLMDEGLTSKFKRAAPAQSSVPRVDINVEKLKHEVATLKQQNGVLEQNLVLLYKTAHHIIKLKDKELSNLKTKYDAMCFRRRDQSNPAALPSIAPSQRGHAPNASLRVAAEVLHAQQGPQTNAGRTQNQAARRAKMSAELSMLQNYLPQRRNRQNEKKSVADAVNCQAAASTTATAEAISRQADELATTAAGAQQVTQGTQAAVQESRNRDQKGSASRLRTQSSRSVSPSRSLKSDGGGTPRTREDRRQRLFSQGQQNEASPRRLQSNEREARKENRQDRKRAREPSSPRSESKRTRRQDEYDSSSRNRSSNSHYNDHHVDSRREGNRHHSRDSVRSSVEMSKSSNHRGTDRYSNEDPAESSRRHTDRRNAAWRDADRRDTDRRDVDDREFGTSRRRGQRREDTTWRNTTAREDATGSGKGEIRRATNEGGSSGSSSGWKRGADCRRSKSRSSSRSRGGTQRMLTDESHSLRAKRVQQNKAASDDLQEASTPEAALNSANGVPQIVRASSEGEVSDSSSMSSRTSRSSPHSSSTSYSACVSVSGRELRASPRKTANVKHGGTTQPKNVAEAKVPQSVVLMKQEKIALEAENVPLQGEKVLLEREKIRPKAERILLAAERSCTSGDVVELRRSPRKLIRDRQVLGSIESPHVPRPSPTKTHIGKVRTIPTEPVGPCGDPRIIRREVRSSSSPTPTPTLFLLCWASCSPSQTSDQASFHLTSRGLANMSPRRSPRKLQAKRLINDSARSAGLKNAPPQRPPTPSRTLGNRDNCDTARTPPMSNWFENEDAFDPSKPPETPGKNLSFNDTPVYGDCDTAAHKLDFDRVLDNSGL